MTDRPMPLLSRVALVVIAASYLLACFGLRGTVALLATAAFVLLLIRLGESP